MENSKVENLLQKIDSLSLKDLQWFLAGLEKIKEEKFTKASPRRFTPAEYEEVSERVEIKVEYVDGQIVPKEGTEPLPEWVVDEILSPNFNLSDLDFEFPMSTEKHHDVIANLFTALVKNIDDDKFKVYGQGPEIFISLSGNYRIPDVTVSPNKENSEWKNEKLLNPLVLIEVLSPSNKGESFEQKLADYQSIPSLQEYWLVAQDKRKIQRYVRNEDDTWTHHAYSAEDEEIEFPTLEIKLKMEKVYRDVIFEN
jgi:Uma2 family endonuclease